MNRTSTAHLVDGTAAEDAPAPPPQLKHMVPPPWPSPGAREPSASGTSLASLLPLGPGEKITFSVQLASGAAVLK